MENYRLGAREELKKLVRRAWEIQIELDKASPEAYTHKDLMRKLQKANENLKK